MWSIIIIATTIMLYRNSILCTRRELTFIFDANGNLSSFLEHKESFSDNICYCTYSLLSHASSRQCMKEMAKTLQHNGESIGHVHGSYSCEIYDTTNNAHIES